MATTIERHYHRGHRGAQGTCLPLWLSFCSFAEDRRPHAHTRCALFNRYFEIMRHAHGKSSHTNLRQVARGDTVPNLTELAEIRSRALRIFCIRRDGHQAVNIQISPSRRAPEDLFQFVRALFVRVWGDSALCLLAPHIDLDQGG